MENILICGSELGHIVFYDIRNPSQVLSIFYKTQTEDICKIAMNGQGRLVSSSEDLSTVVYDLTQNCEEDATDLILNTEDSAERIIFWQNNFVIEGSTNKIMSYNFESGVREINYHY